MLQTHGDNLKNSSDPCLCKGKYPNPSKTKRSSFSSRIQNLPGFPFTGTPNNALAKANPEKYLNLLPFFIRLREIKPYRNAFPVPVLP